MVDPHEQNPYDHDPYGQAPPGQNGSDQNAYEQYPYGQNAYGQNPYGQNPYGQAPPGQNAYGPSPYGPNPYGRPAPGPALPVTLAQPFYDASLVEAFTRFWRKYATFTGRASRSEFWWWVLCDVIIGIVLGLIGLGIHVASAGMSMASLASVGRGFTASTVISGVWLLATIVPRFALAIRRLHDADRSGWWYLLAVPSWGYNLVQLVHPVSTATFLPGQAPEAQAFTSAVIVLGVSVVVLLIQIPLLVFYLTAPRPEGQRFDRSA